MKRGSVRPVLTPTQARFLLSAARRAKEECNVGDERRTWEGAARALSVAIQEMRSAALADPAGGEETYRCPHGRGSNESCRFCSVTGELE